MAGSDDFASLSLFLATPEQVVESRRRTWVQWGRGLTIEQYLERDASMDSLEHARDGKLRTWVLAPRSDPTTLEFKCACETFRRVGLISGTSAGAVPEEVVCYGVASVFTPAQYRRKGYANHMMRLLHWVLGARDTTATFPDAWGTPPEEIDGVPRGICSVLYSDIGPDFYRKCGKTPEDEGWVLRGANATVWNVEETLARMTGAEKSAGEWRWLDEDECKTVWEDDERRMRKDLVEAAAALAQSEPRVDSLFTVLPGGGTAASQIARSKFYLQASGKPEADAAWGVALYGEQDSIDGYATWTLDLPAPTMILTRLRAIDETFAGLLARVLKAAKKAGMTRVEAWNLPLHLQGVAKDLGGEYEDRKDHLSAISWYGKEHPGEVHWLFNERFCWC
ncbi:hypothetical protein PUNSTDRAFT_121969 [Punctularia strigosozonata HHB-11173 SS5]|uniref:uncharacterized protein n=1 Tax=Punctularia strigosozonata (strain HHB-11173) TaxID=741275 RepID=UPI00044186F0|nr:uncharacterized protein PUNSTDRAFT_121969 [Punctularia strigosozonata HHB-11173 SS5]EIN06031.1 hypothetical protein PUNSTDRAFT_121969 [Punctularia strigosozonata HHB-11173 SS5]